MAFLSLKNVVGGEFSNIPVGRYNFVIENCELRISKTQKEMISIRFKIIDDNQKNRVIFDNIVIGDPTYGEGAIRKFKAICVACGFDDDFDDPSDLVILNDKVLSARITHSFDKGTGRTVEKMLDFQVFDYEEPAKSNGSVKKVAQKAVKEPTQISKAKKEDKDDLPF